MNKSAMCLKTEKRTDCRVTVYPPDVMFQIGTDTVMWWPIHKQNLCIDRGYAMELVISKRIETGLRCSIKYRKVNSSRKTIQLKLKCT